MKKNIILISYFHYFVKLNKKKNEDKQCNTSNAVKRVSIIQDSIKAAHDTLGMCRNDCFVYCCR